MEPLVTIGIVTVIVDVVLVIGQAVLHWQNHRYAKAIGRIETLEAELKASAKEQVKAAIESETGELRASMKLLGFQIQQHSERLNAGDGGFKQIEQSAFEQRLKMLNDLHELSLTIHREGATKEGLKELAERIEQCQKTCPAELIELKTRVELLEARKRT